MRQQLLDSKQFTVEWVASCVTAVDDLLAHCCPAAVCWFVITVIVNTVKRCLLDAVCVDVAYVRDQHVRLEVGVYGPTLAHGDSSAAVVGEGAVTWVGTPGDHVSPSFAQAKFVCA